VIFFYLILNQICASVVIDKFYGDFADNGWCVRNACVLIVSLNSWVIVILKKKKTLFAMIAIFHGKVRQSCLIGK
jgi:hypothetical protein